MTGILSGLGRVLLGALIVITAAQAANAQDRKLPYWASLASGDVLMRTGPERTFPAIWRYRRRDLPVQVIQIYGDWRKVKEVDGTEGWMLSTLMSAKRTAIVVGQSPAPMHAEPTDGSAVNWQAEPGVVGKMPSCEAGWCLFDVAGKKGYIRSDRIWGASPGESSEE
ncbi:SH3 domain-containing protein [Sphingomonas montanisoli]|uniref:SH3 domain-containing protein n=1 Tax=Sphingomonas montanisoli TaxID=2606412 RepID=A0A5D9C174_9SPHN|nr:SH3 domain-containing protein [Sphingomonas montanisoli]TZG25042.1 hypothetical protein FYJ91_17410 [Sphingomonas montanisoli]